MRAGRLLIGALLLLGLYFTSLFSYPLFHGLVEIFSVAVAFGIFMLVWNSRRFQEDDALLLLGIAYLFVGSLDLVHTLSYTGTGIFREHGTNLPTQLWIGARLLESLSLLVFSQFFKRRFRVGLAFATYAVVTSLFLTSVFYWQVFPTCFIEGQGLTPFKKVSEYVISVILLVAAGVLIRKRRELDAGVFRLLLGSLLVTIGSELAFTFYVHAYGLPNLIGHFLKIVSFYLIYKALIEVGLRKPYDLIFRNLKHSEERNRALLSAIPDMMFLVGRDGTYLDTQAPPQAPYYVPPSQFLGKKVGDVMPPEVAGPTMEKIERTLATGKMQLLELELPIAAETRHFESRFVACGDEEVLTIVRDTTQSKRAEEELRQYAETQAVLLREVNHRVKNNLAAIIAMLRQEEGRAATAPYLVLLRELEGRVRGLATVHNLLSANGWRPLALSELCRQVIRAALRSVPLQATVDLTVHHSPVKVDSHQAHQLTLVLNELTTNSVKHALSGRESMRLEVTVELVDDHVLLSFRDDGSGFPEELVAGDFSRANVGLDLIRGIVTRNLNGAVSLSNDPGAVTTISFSTEVVAASP